MDFDSSFFDCCKSCNSTSQKYSWPRSGQGDCNCSSDVQERNLWKKAPSEDKLKSKILQETEERGLKKEKEKKLLDAGCSCLTNKTKQKQEYKLMHENKQDKNEPDIFENFSNSWKSKMERFYVSEERKYHTISEKLLTENILELEKKVDFLLRTLKHCGRNHPNISFFENMQTNGTATLGDAWHMFNFNRRLCAAEEGIEKLALILEELLKESYRNRGVFLPNEALTCSESSAYDEMTVGQKLSFLKNRNKALLSLIKTFLKSSSVEEICSKLSEDFESQFGVSRPEEMGGRKKQLKDFSCEEIISRLEDLKVETKDIQPEKKTQSNSEDSYSKTGIREFGLKHSRSRLEAISEQAELTLTQDGSIKGIDEFDKKNELRNFTEKLSHISEESNDSDSGLRDVTSRLLAQEAMLKSSLDKVQLELLPKLDSPEKTFTKTNLNIFKNAQTSANEDVGTSKTDLDSLSTPLAPTKHSKKEEFKKPIKEEGNPTGGNPRKDSFSKKTDEQLGKKNRYNHKVLNKSNCSSSEIPQKLFRTSFDPRSSSRKGNKQDSQAQEERPSTAPISLKKPTTPSSCKGTSPEKSTRKNSGINNNVRIKNKILLSKKSLVHTP